MESVKNALILHENDNVATVLTEVSRGDTVRILDVGRNTVGTFTANGDIIRGHKIAVRTILPGEDVIKYGQVIGVADVCICPGDYVHTHNFGSKRGRGDLKA